MPDKDKTDKASIFRLDGYINYQEESVVSREIVNKPTGTVTIFAFDKGQGLSEHTAPYDALIYVLDGKADVAVAGEFHQVEKGEVIIIPANQPHSLKAVEKFKIILVMIRS